MYKINHGHLTVFCIVFVCLGGPPSPVRIITQVLWFMYQNRYGGIYYPNFVPCFVVLYLNQIILTQCILKDVFDYKIWIKWIRINQFSPNEFISLLQTHCSFFIAIECTTHDFLDNFGINSCSISNNELLIMIIFCLELTKFGIMPNPSAYHFMTCLSKGLKRF